MEDYLLRRQRKTFLETCRRIAVVGMSPHPDSASYVATEKLLGLGVEILPVIPGRREFLAMPCYARLGDITGEIDIVQVYPGKKIHMTDLARETVEKSASAFWIEEGHADPGVREILAGGGVQVVEHERLATEYIKHVPSPASTSGASTTGTRSVTVGDRMTKNPVTVKPGDALNEALDKMKKGGFRHLPVVDEEGKLIGMISDRDIRLIRPSLAFVSSEDAAAQLWSIAVRQAAVFNPVTIPPDAPLEQAAELMLRWEVGGLPVVDKDGKPIGIVTYTDLLREFVAGDKEH
jgi:CBS domain-containing protein